MADYTRGRSKSLNDVMKTLSYLRFVKGLPALNEAFAFLKVFAFELFKTEASSNNNASALTSAIYNTNRKVLNKTVYKEMNRQRCLLVAAMTHHMDLIRQLQTLQKKCLMYQENQRKCHEIQQMNLEQSEAEKTKGKEKEILNLQKKRSMNEELTELAYLSYQTLLEKEKCTRHEMQQLSDALQQQVVERARDKLAESLEVLEDLAWNNKLPVFILEKIKSIDCQYASEQLYKHICKAYVFPDPEEWTIRTGYHVKLQDPALFSSDYCLNKGEFLRLVDIEEPDTELESRPEDIYVKAANNCKKGTGSSLTFKRGNIFKQKLVSADGTVGFGWKRSTGTGMKVWGHYQTCFVKFDHFPKK